MARKRDHRDVTQRENPYGQLPEDEVFPPKPTAAPAP